MVENGYPDLAPICLTHGFISKDIKQSDYPTYRPKLLKQVADYLSDLEYNDYDRIIQLADLFSRGKEILSIHQRLEKNKKFYHIKDLSYEQDAYDLRDYINSKYHINVEHLVQETFKQPVGYYPPSIIPDQHKPQPFKLYRFDGRFA